MFDLVLLTLSVANSQEQPDLPGFLAANAPRRAARGRTEDQLIVLLGRKGSPLPDDADLKAALERAVKTYYQTPGPVTAAMRAAAESLSKDLLARGRRSSEAPSQSGYLLNLAVLHGSMLYLGHCGPVYACFTSETGAQHFHDSSADGRAFGLGQGASLRFFQTEVASGGSLVLAPEAANPLAHQTPQALQNQTVEQLSQVLLAGHPQTLAAALVQIKAGSGKIDRVQAPSSTPLSRKPLTVDFPAAAPDLSPAGPEVFDDEIPPAESEDLLTEPAAFDTPLDETPAEAASAAPSTPAPDHRWPGRFHREPAPRAEHNPEPESPRSRAVSLPVLRFLSRLLHGGERIQGASSQAVGNFFTRMLPGQSGQPYSLSPMTMAFVAIAVPLVIVTLGLAVYFERGRDKMFQTHFAQAVQAASLTQDQTDPAILRSAWSQTLYWLDKAETNLTTTDSQALRGQAQQALDQLDSITRMDFQPAIVGELAAGVNVTEIIATSSDLYLLNSAQGKVIRAVLTGRGFEVDPDFHCEPGPSGSYIIGELIDIALMPKGNEFHATVMAMDGTGNLLFCGPGTAPTSIPLAPPDNNWGKIVGMTYASNGLYILDPVNNAVWVYDGMGAFRDRPRMFFGNQVPVLGDAVDLASSGDDLFLLHADGHMTLCKTTYGSQSDPQCSDPATLTDPRPGREKNVTKLLDTHFTQIQYTQPPDPSLYMLNPAEGSIYHFSLRLNLQRQMRPFAGTNDPFPDQGATAFAVAPNRMVFIAFANRVFYGIAP